MTPLLFEETYRGEWTELEALIDQVVGRNGARSSAESPVSGARVAALYRRACEQLALARAQRVVEWGGDPRKQIDKAGEDRTSLHPRKSFEVWRETVRARSLPWERAVISAVREFQGVASGIVA